MVVFIASPYPQQAGHHVEAEVKAVHDSTVDLELLDLRLYGWRGPMYDKDGNEIPLEKVRRDFLSQDTTALMARIAQLEQIVTQP